MASRTARGQGWSHPEATVAPTRPRCEDVGVRRRARASGGVGARRSWRVPLAAAIGALTIGATGCAGPTAPATAGPVQLEIVQLRGDVAGGFVELRVTNDAATELVIERASYASSAWSAPMERVDEARIPPGARRNLRMQLPEPTCEAGTVEHRAVLELADGTVVEGEPGDPLGQLEALDDAVCDRRAFERDVARLRWLPADIPPDGARAAVLQLEVAPAAGAGAPLGSVDDIGATVLLAPADAAGDRIESLPAALEVVAGAGPTVVDVPLVPGRCDLHAIAEDKQGTIFRIRATAGDEPVQLVLPVPDDQRDALLGWVVARCAR